MVVVVYVSGISGNKEVKKRQQRVLMILDSKSIKYDVIDIAEPGREADKDFMQNNAKSNGGTVSDPNPRSPLPPQLFNDDEYCGDYDEFDMANEVDTLEQFLKLEAPPEEPPQNGTSEEDKLNGDVLKDSKENSQEKEDAAIKPEEEESTPEDAPAIETKEKSPTPDKIDDVSSDKLETEKEASVEKEIAPVAEATVESKKSSKENTPDNTDDVNENGKVSSREQSQEKDAGDVIKETVDDPSVALISSEQAAAED